MSNRSLVIFTKAPIPGQVKTRLSPPLTDASCAELQQAFIQDAVSKFRKVEAALKICFSPDHAGPFFADFDLETYPQSAGDLGDRMFRALQAELSKGFRKVLLVGTDTPLVRPEEVSEGYELLETADMVFGPATDGGYYCIGTRRPLPNTLFSGIPWSTARVLELSEARASDAGLVTARMRTSLDVDTPEDLRALRDAGPGGATQKVLEKLSQTLTF